MMDNSTLLILVAILVIWLGIFLYLWNLDRKVDRLGRKVDRQ
jgi:CcmD family protein